MEVRSNFAVSLDGQISTRERSPVRFSSKEDRREMAKLRAWADAVLVGAATLRADDPSLGLFDARLRAARRRAGRAEEPLRCVVTRRGALDSGLRLFTHACDRAPIVFAPARAAAALRKNLGDRAEVIGPRGLSVTPRAIVAALASRHGVRRLLVEGGGDVHFGFLRADLVDEIHVTLCPVLLGGEDGAPRLADGAGFPPESVLRLELVSVRRGERETFLRYRVAGRTPLERRTPPRWRGAAKTRKTRAAKR
jgi:5-amino-6-(5-phosphoribosylamino)uracil reductase